VVPPKLKPGPRTFISGKGINSCCVEPAVAALFELTGRVPSKETKTYLGAGLAVLGVNLVSIICMQLSAGSLILQFSAASC
jgi:hypothetical protein